MGLLKAPLPIHGMNFPIVQYADDALLLMQAHATQLLCLKALLNTFAQSTGLHVVTSRLPEIGPAYIWLLSRT